MPKASPGRAVTVLTGVFVLAGAFRSQAESISPTVSVTSPVDGATVTRTITVAANTLNSAGISGVQFQLDGMPLGSPVTGSRRSYLMSWDTTTVADGPHTLGAVATDKSDNTTTSIISISIANQLKLNQRIHVNAGVDVHATPSLASAPVRIQPGGALGTVVGEPSSDGQNTWWQINYDDGSSGWTTSDSIQPLASLNIPTNTWIPVQPSYVGQPNGGQIWPSGWGNKGSYDPVTHRVIISDRWYDTTHLVSIFANGLHAYDPVQNVFSILKLNNWYAQPTSSGGFITTPLPSNTTDPTPPDHHPLALFEVVPGQNAVYTVNGVNSISLPDPSILNRGWRFDLGTHSWTMVSSALTDPNFPPNNVGAPSGLIYDPASQKLVYLNVNSCGCSGTSTYLYNLGSNTWTAVLQDVSSLGVNIGGAGVTYDSKRNLIMAFGGNVNITVSPTAHLWAYSVAQNRWTQLADAPVAALAPGFAYDSTHDIFLALVGNSTYSYNPITNTWSLLPAILNRPSAVLNWQGITYDPAYDVFVFEGGNWQTPYMALFRYGSGSSLPPSISAVSPGSITSSGATITWTTDQASDSQVAFGLTNAYGLTSTLAPALVTAHSVNLTGLSASTTYHYKVLSRNSQGALGSSADFTFTTAAPSQALLQLHADATEVSAVTNGSIVTPSTGPAGFRGTVVVSSGGSVNFTPARIGNGVFFLNCCSNTSDAYYKFTGAALGSIFNVNRGQISFYLRSRYSFSQRLTTAAGQRFAFDVRDNNVNNHLFYFRTQISSGYLQFSYVAGGPPQFYYVPKGTEDTLFGSGVVLKVTITWDGSVSRLYLNDVQVQSAAYIKSTPNWTAASNFDLGAYEYATFGGYNASDDVIDEFTVYPQ